MTKRVFFKLLTFAGLGSLIPIPKLPATPARQYLTSCRWDELIGLRFHWNSSPNPSPGMDWEVFKKEAENGWFEWKETWIHNHRNNIYYGRPVGLQEPVKILCFPPLRKYETEQSFEWDFTRVDLGQGTFYRP